jgi:hypothetical protein
LYYEIKSVEYVKVVTDKRHRMDYLEADVDLLSFLYRNDNARLFFNIVDQKLMPKILEDIFYISAKGWARQIPTVQSNVTRPRAAPAPTEGFYHCHILGVPGLRISRKRHHKEEDIERILSPTNVSILYHTREFTGESNTPEHNILSSLTSKPHPINPHQFPEKDSAVNHVDLNKNHYAQINFAKDNRKAQQHRESNLYETPKYRLEDGTMLEVKGLLLVFFLGRDILKIEPRLRDQHLRHARRRQFM